MRQAEPAFKRAFGAGLSLRKQQPKQGALLPIGLSSALTGGVDWPACGFSFIVAEKP